MLSIVYQQNRKQLFDSIDLISRYNSNLNQEKLSKQINLFANSTSATLPNLIVTDNWSMEEKLIYEGEALGFYLTYHPLDKYRHYLNDLAIKNSNYIRNDLAAGFSQVKIAGVAISIKTRVSPRGRFLSVLFSDSYGSFEVSIFDDDILSTSRDLLVSKLPLLIVTEAKKDEGGIRLTAQSVTSLDHYISKKYNKLLIWLNKIEAVEPLKDLFTISKNSIFKVNIIVQFKQQLIEIELGSAYNIDLDNLKLIDKIDGITGYQLVNH